MATNVTSAGSSTEQANAQSKKPQTSFRDIVSLIVPGNREKALKQAITNAIAILLVIVILVAVVAIHVVLTPFLRPLVWALVFGSVLHPLKRSLSLSTQQWLDELKNNETPIVFGLMLLPFSLVNNFVSRLAKSLYQYKNILLVNFVILPMIYFSLTKYGDAQQFYSLITNCYYTIIYNIPEFIEENNQSAWLFWLAPTLIVAHLIFVVLLPWNNSTKAFLHWSTLAVALVTILQLVLFHITFGILLIFVIFMLVLTGLVTYEENSILTGESTENAQSTKTPIRSIGRNPPSALSANIPRSINRLNDAFVDSYISKRDTAPSSNESLSNTSNLRNRVSRNLSLLVQSFLNTTTDLQRMNGNEEEEAACADVFEIEEHQNPETNDQGDVFAQCSTKKVVSKQTSKWSKTPITTSTPIQTASQDKLTVKGGSLGSSDETKLSEAYLYGLIWVFILSQFWFHPRLAYVVIPFILSILAISWLFTKLRDRMFNKSNTDKTWIERKISNWFNARKDVLVHPGIRTTYKYLIKGDRKLIDGLEGYVDAVSSACVIFFMVITVLFTALYLSFQIYAESVYLIEKISHSINSILINNPDLKQLLPDGFTGVNSLLDDAVNNTYIHGREWIKTSTRQLLNNAAMENFNKTQSKIIERQMVEFWDRAYILWLKRRDNGTVSVATIDLEQIPYDWNRLFDALQSLDFSLCIQIVKQNLNTLLSVTDSILSVLRGNLNLVLGAITAALSVVVVGGNALVNFIINLIIFTTALFYLLCASGEHYKPLQLINNIMPDTESKPLIRLRTRTGFLESVNESVNAVFAASFKMMAFHGLFTWLLHTLFELEVVYIPSVISAIFGAVPFLSPYWASIPAVIDLWLSDLKAQSTMMALLATLPSSFVSTAFYSEIKGAGHPYLTGLAIAGGVLVFGIEGALFGPMLLVVIRLLSLVVMYFMDVYR